MTRICLRITKKQDIIPIERPQIKNCLQQKQVKNDYTKITVTGAPVDKKSHSGVSCTKCGSRTMALGKASSQT